ncbi:MAG: response regulator transcription factor [Vulcanimicrobiota bacterium]
MSYRILLAEDHPLVRAGVRAELETNPHYQIVGEAEDACRVESLLAHLQPDLLILDILLGRNCSLDCVPAWCSAAPTMKILILSALSEGAWIASLGHPSIAGFVTKDESPQCLLQAVRVIESGQQWFSQSLAGGLREAASRRKRPDLDRLTGREEQVLELMRQALGNSEIARKLGVSVHTVRRCATGIYQKLRVNSRVEAILHSSHPVTASSFNPGGG